MTLRYTQSDDSNELLDLSSIFIGRQQQLDLFQIYLTRWQQRMFDADEDEALVTDAPSPNNKLQGLVVMLYGRGGFGKSTLLTHYKSLARQSTPPLIISRTIDWEFAIEGKRSLFNPAPGQEIDTSEYFKLLCAQFALVLDKKVSDFKNYRDAVTEVAHAQKDAERLVDSIQKDDRFAFVRQATGEGLVRLLRLVPVGGALLKDDKIAEKASEVLGSGAAMTAGQLIRLHNHLKDRLGTKLGDYLNPALKLGLGLGSDLSDFARNYPLLIFFDTYEEVDEGDALLRIVMAAAGLRVGWILAGRDNLWAGMEQRERSIDTEYGYKDIVPPDRGLSINFNSSDVGAFTLSDITDYFALMRKKVQHVLLLPELAEKDVQRILDVTQGVPLAVKIAAGLYLETADLNKITEKVEGKREIVDQMVRRYLLHARDNQDERATLYALALLRRADHPAAVTAALGLTPEESRTSYASTLSRLHRRYSFIFTEKDEPALHQEVRHFLRLWLREHRSQPEIIAINERLKAAHEAELKRLEEQRMYRTLKDRLLDEEWTGVYLDLTEQQFWLDPVVGVCYILPFMIAAAIYNREMNEDAAKAGEFFAANIAMPYRDWWKWADQSLTYYDSHNSLNEELAGLEMLANLVKSRRCPSFPLSLPDCKAELEAALWWRLGEAYLDKDGSKALGWYEKCLERLNDEAMLKEHAAIAYGEVAKKLKDEKKYAESITLLNRAIELMPDDVNAYFNRGIAYDELKEYQRSIEDYTRALELDPNLASAYNNRGITYRHLKEYKLAIEDYSRALKLDPNYASAYHNRGFTYYNLKEYERAIEDYTRALDLDPNLAPAYGNRGNVYRHLKEYQQAIEDYTRVLDLDPNDVRAYHNRGLAYYNLKEYERAIEDYTHVLELDPNDAIAYGNRGNSYRHLKEYERAIEDYTRALELDPNYASVYNNRGIACRYLKEYKRAIEDYTHALELDPNYISAYSSRGIAHLWLKNTSQARSDYTHRYELDPTNINAAWMAEWAGMGKQLLSIDAAEQLEKIATISPQYYIAYVCRGIAFGLRGKLKEGLAELEQAIPLKPEEWDAYFWKGLLCAYYYKGRYQLAIDAIEKALEVGLPPILLTPLHWLEKDRPDFFEQYARPLLEKYGV